MTKQEALYNLCLRIGDTSLIHGHRLSEWCGHGPILEEDIALTNIALDLVGQSRTLLQYASQIEGKGRTEDDIAYLRPEREFLNALIAERPNGDYAATITKVFFVSAFQYYYYSELQKSKDETFAAFAAKSIKEVTYHLRHSSQWVIRLGDGTEESHERMQNALNDLWQYTGDMFDVNESDELLQKESIVPDMKIIKEQWIAKIKEVMQEATLSIPAESWMQSGSRKGIHSEHLGFLLAELQYMQRAYPGAKW